MFTLAADFKPQDKDAVVDVASLIDGTSRLREMDEANQVPREMEEYLARNVVALIARSQPLPIGEEEAHRPEGSQLLYRSLVGRSMVRCHRQCVQRAPQARYLGVRHQDPWNAFSPVCLEIQAEGRLRL